LFTEEIKKIGVAYDVVSLATPVILKYMNESCEGRFDFYKIHPEKRVKLLEFSSREKKVDPFIFINDSIICLNSIIELCKEEELFIIIPDCRYMYEIKLIAEKVAVDNFFCINVHRMIEDIEEYSDREKQFYFPSLELVVESGGMWIELHNDSDIESLRLNVDNIFKRMRLGYYA